MEFDEYSDVSVNRSWHVELYEDAQRRKDRKDKVTAKHMDIECTFHPDIGINKYMSRSNHASVVDWLSNHNQSVLEHSHIHKHNADKFDPNTGQPFFKPKILWANWGRDPSKPVGEKLYENSIKQMQRKAQWKQSEDDRRDEIANSKFAKRTTDQLVERKKEKKLCEIFLMLDSDGDGLISA